MERGTIEDLIDRSDERLGQFDAFSDTEDVFFGLASLSSVLKGEAYSGESVLTDGYKAVEKAYFRKKILEYGREIKNVEGGGSCGCSSCSCQSPEDFVQVSKPKTGLAGERKLKEAKRLMEEVLRSLEKAGSERAALRYGGTGMEELSVLDSQVAPYLEAMGKSIENLDASNELFGELSCEKDPNVAGEAQKNFYKTEIRRNFEKGRLNEAYAAFYVLHSGNSSASELMKNFISGKRDSIARLRNSPAGRLSLRSALEEMEGIFPDPMAFVDRLRVDYPSDELSLYDVLEETEKILSDPTAFVERAKIGRLMEVASVHLPRSKESFQAAIAACDEAAGLGYRGAVPEGYRARSEESIRRIEGRILRVDGMLALKGHEHQAADYNAGRKN